MSNISTKIPKGYFQTEFDLVNNTNSEVSFNLFDVNTLNAVQTQPQPIVAPSIVSNISLGLGKQPTFGAYCSQNGTIYVVNSDNTIDILNATTNVVVGTLSISASYLVYNSNENTMYISCLDNNVRVLSCNDNSIISTFLVGNVFLDLTFDSGNNKVYGALTGSLNLWIIDCNTNTLSSISYTDFVTAVSYNSHNNSIYFGDSSGNVNIFDCSSNSIVGSPISLGGQVISIEYNTLNNSMYASNIALNSVSVINCTSNTVTSTISSISSPAYLQYNNLLNYMYLTQLIGVNTSIYVLDCSTNTFASPISSVGTLPYGMVYVSNLNTLYTMNTLSDDVGVVSPTVLTTTYIGGTFNYNQFLQDIQDNPVIIRDAMFYSSEPENINQVFFTQFKDANGKSSLTPRYPQLSVGVNQFQGSVSKVDFGEKGFPLDVTHSFYNVTVQANSTLKIILIAKQIKKSYNLDAPDISEQIDLIKNNVQYVKGVDGRNNIERFSVFNFGKDEK